MTEEDKKNQQESNSTSDSNESSEEPASKDKKAEKLQRRAFFSEGFRSLLKPFTEMVEQRLDHFNRAFEESKELAMGGSDDTYTAGISSASYYQQDLSRLLRPPGALAEELFVDRCACSSQCVSVCPVQAIQVLESDDPRTNGTPFIDPQIQACVLCEDLICMTVCPTGALQSVPKHLINIGVAEFHPQSCLRPEGEDCRICVEKCPLGATAIEIPDDGDEVRVKEDGCVGCGVCEMYCPTEPRAITVKLE